MRRQEFCGSGLVKRERQKKELGKSLRLAGKPHHQGIMTPTQNADTHTPHLRTGNVENRVGKEGLGWARRWRAVLRTDVSAGTSRR